MALKKIPIFKMDVMPQIGMGVKPKIVAGMRTGGVISTGALKNLGKKYRNSKGQVTTPPKRLPPKKIPVKLRATISTRPIKQVLLPLKKLDVMPRNPAIRMVSEWQIPNDKRKPVKKIIKPTVVDLTQFIPGTRKRYKDVAARRLKQAAPSFIPPPSIDLPPQNKLKPDNIKPLSQEEQTKMSNVEKNRKSFLQWTKKKFPKLYQRALLDVQSKKGLGESDSNGFTDFFGNIFSSLKDLAPSVLQFKQQKSLMKMQLERAKQGLPPANVADYTPTFKAQVDLAPSTRRAVITGATDMMKPILIGGAALAAFLILRKKF